jgi:hypothetical protein
MSKRSERRAAERAAHKANRLHLQAQTPVQAAAAAPQPAEKAFAVGATESIPESTASEAQINANRANAQHSTGPTSEAGKQKVSQNRRTHGLAGEFFFLSTELPADYHALAASVYEEYNPQTDTEARLADSLIQHYWLMQRAITYQNINFDNEKKLALFLRYQATHERAYYKAQKELIRLQKDRAKEEIGFESQNAKTRLNNARAENLEIDTACRKVMEVPLPGNYKISFEQIAHACSIGIATLVSQQQQQSQQQAA